MKTKILIGKPIINTKVYILDQHLNPVPIGIPGELYIGGIGLARGYLNRRELTEAKFIVNPFGLGRLYKTGDLVRYHRDGNIEFLGRIDNQVKIRGFRIELGEIESALSIHPEIEQTVVVVGENEQGDKYLVAYVVSKNQSLNSPELRNYLKAQLPEYMIPSAFVFLESLPLTPNGKIDRKSLPTPENQPKDEEYIAPITPNQEILANIWQEVLGVKKVGINNNFFELGGHSLLAVRLIFTIEQQLEKKLPLSVLFQNPTIEQLSQVITTVQSPQDNSVIVALQPNGQKKPLFCIHPVGGNVFCYGELAKYLQENYDIPIYGLKSLGLEEQQPPLTSISSMAAAYIEAIQTIQPLGPYYLAGWSMGGIIALEIAQQLKAQNHQVALLTLIDTYLPSHNKTLKRRKNNTMIKLFAQDLSGIYNTKINLEEDKIQELNPEQQLDYLLNQIKQEKIGLSKFSREQMSKLWEVFQANYSALQQYQPQPYAEQVILFEASQKPAEVRQDRLSKWNALISGQFDNYTLKGNHYTIMNYPEVSTIARTIGRKIQELD